MKYNYKLTLERDGEKMVFNPEVYFYKNEDTYGNGYYMTVENCGFDFLNVFDCRYDKRLNPEKLNEYFPVFARDKWTGENGSAKLISIEDGNMRIGEIKKLNNTHGEDFTVKILNFFECDGVEYAEVEPVGFNGFTREVPTERLKEVTK